MEDTTISMGPTMSVDLNEVEEFVKSPDFSTFLVSNTTDFSVAAFVLQTLFDKIKELKGE